MKQSEVRDKIAELSKEVYKLSDEIAKGLEPDGLDNTYLASKVRGLINVCKHVEGQLKRK